MSKSIYGLRHDLNVLQRKRERAWLAYMQSGFKPETIGTKYEEYRAAGLAVKQAELDLANAEYHLRQCPDCCGPLDELEPRPAGDDPGDPRPYHGGWHCPICDHHEPKSDPAHLEYDRREAEATGN